MLPQLTFIRVKKGGTRPFLLNIRMSASNSAVSFSDIREPSGKD